MNRLIERLHLSNDNCVIIAGREKDSWSSEDAFNTDLHEMSNAKRLAYETCASDSAQKPCEKNTARFLVQGFGLNFQAVGKQYTTRDDSQTSSNTVRRMKPSRIGSTYTENTRQFQAINCNLQSPYYCDTNTKLTHINSKWAWS
jgi:hypothetical protein